MARPPELRSATTAVMGPRYCPATAPDGSPCRVPRLSGQSHCWNHAPGADMDERREEARRAGGRARGLQMTRPSLATGLEEDPPEWWELSSAADTRAAFGWCVRELATGRLDSRTGNAMVAALNGLVGSLRDEEQEERLRTLERAVNINR